MPEKQMVTEQEKEGWVPKQISWVLEALNVKLQETAKSSQYNVTSNARQTVKEPRGLHHQHKLPQQNIHPIGSQCQTLETL